MDDVKRIIEQVIKKPIPDTQRNFFDQGLVDSLSAVALLVKIEETLGVSFDILDFARREDFTLDHISQLIAASKKDR